MKHTLIILFSAFLIQVSFAQTLFTPGGTLGTSSNGNVGIGITNPNGNLHLFGHSAGNGNVLSSLVLGKTIGIEIQAIQENSDDDVQGMAFRVKSSGFSGDPNFEAMRLTKDGNLGIGITNPNGDLHLFGHSAGNGNVLSSLVLGKTIGVEIQAIQEHTDDDVQGMAFRVKSSSFSGDPNFEAMRLTKDGNLGIGTTSPDPNFKLSVNGSIRSKEVKVEANWSDFVFYDNYNLRTLEEVEQHINENGHLPEIPSEAEVTENGINLGEMNAKLLQKIEELTLYLIEQNKQNQAQQEQLETQHTIIEQLKNEVSALKSE